MPAYQFKTDNISHEKAAQIAAGWGSLISAGDSGAIFYTFPSDGKPPQWSDGDRAAALTYCDQCLIIARDYVSRGVENVPGGDAAQDVADLESLRIYIAQDESPRFDDLDPLTQGYIECMFFTASDGTEHDEDSPDYGVDLTEMGFQDLAPETLKNIIDDVKRFTDLHSADIEALVNTVAHGDGPYDMNSVGLDFWYTRNGHGVGFWDRGFKDAASDAAGRITKTLEWNGPFGEMTLIVGDDSKLYLE